jgi:small subunit ribosomal protein S3
LSVNRNWTSKWYANSKNFVQGMLLKTSRFVSSEEEAGACLCLQGLIERPAKNARITLFSARPGVVIGKKGEDIEALRKHSPPDVGAGAREHRRSAQA